MTRTPLMPKATAVWLVDNTSLTFEQSAEFCQNILLPFDNGCHNRCLQRVNPLQNFVLQAPV